MVRQIAKVSRHVAFHIECRDSLSTLEKGSVNRDEFREFMFTNAVRMRGWVNPDLFKGTIVESEAAKMITEAVAKSASISVGAGEPERAAAK
jgi:hypothetical protein